MLFIVLPTVTGYGIGCVLVHTLSSMLSVAMTTTCFPVTTVSSMMSVTVSTSPTPTPLSTAAVTFITLTAPTRVSSVRVVVPASVAIVTMPETPTAILVACVEVVKPWRAVKPSWIASLR